MKLQSLEAYYQEAGRAGRDGELAECGELVNDFSFGCEIYSCLPWLNESNYMGFTVLYADLSRAPTLLPSRRSKEQTEQAYKMLSDCFRSLYFSYTCRCVFHLSFYILLYSFSFFLCRYGMNTSQCRAKILVEYFGEDFSSKKCNL